MNRNPFIETTIDTAGFCRVEVISEHFSAVLSELWEFYPLSLMERVVIKCVHQIGALSYEGLINTITSANLGHVQLRDVAVALGRYYAVEIVAHPHISHLESAARAEEQLKGGRLYSTEYIAKNGDFALYFSNLPLFRSITERFCSEGAKLVVPTSPARIPI